MEVEKMNRRMAAACAAFEKYMERDGHRLLCVVMLTKEEVTPFADQPADLVQGAMKVAWNPMLVDSSRADARTRLIDLLEAEKKAGL